MWLSELYIFGGHYGGKHSVQSRFCQDVADFVEPGTGCDRQRNSAGRGLHGGWSGLKHYRFICDRPKIVNALPTDQFVQLGSREMFGIFFVEGLETIPVVQRKKFVEVLLVCEFQFLFPGNLSKRLHVNRIVIRQNSVEVEDQSANHECPSLTQVEWAHA